MSRRTPSVGVPDLPLDLDAALAWGARLSDRLREDPGAAYREAEAHVREARRRDLPVVLAVALRARGHARRVRRRIAAALSDYAAARALFRRERLPSQAAGTAIGMVDALSVAGRVREALAMARSARAQLRRSGDRLRAARLEVSLGNLSERLGRRRSAVARYAAAEREFEAMGSATDLAIARFNHANVLAELDRVAEALPLYQQSIDTWASSGRRASLAQCRISLAEALFRSGRSADALVELEDAAAEAHRLGDRTLAATAALNRARIEAWLGRPDRVVSVLGSWVPEFERLSLRLVEVEARVRHAMALIRLGREEEGRRQLDAAERRCVALGQRTRRSWVRYHRALADRARGRIQECRSALTRCVRSFRHAGLRGLEAEARLVRAGTELSLGSAVVARALRVTRSEAMRPDNPWLAERWSRLQARHLVARGSRARLARAFEDAHRRLERLRHSLPEDALRAFLLADRDDLYDDAVALPARRPDLFTPDAAARWAWRWTERAHAPRVRAPEPARHEPRPATDADGADPRARWALAIARERVRLARLDALELAPRLMAHRGQPKPASSAERRRTLGRLETYHRRLEHARAGFVGTPRLGDASAARLQRALHARELLLEYHVGRDALWVVRATRHHADVVRLTADVVETHRIAHRLRRLWDRWRLVPPEGAGAAALRRTEDDLLAELHRRLLAPVIDDASVDDVAVVPHRWLRSLPFHALRGPGGALVDRASVRYGFSAAHALLRARGPGASGPPLIVGVSSAVAPLAADEARAVAERWPDAVPLIGAEARVETVRRRWTNARLVHLAAHGERHPDDPWSSGLLLHDGRFGVYDCDAVHSRAELVVLSACQTGDAVIWGSDDAFGLLPALVRSGARAVVASLWTVSDAATRRWMDALHAHLARGARAEQAVRSASLAARQADSSAFEWAPFALYGARGSGG